MLKVYGRANSINVRKVLWFLGEIGVAFDREDWGRDFRSTDEPEFRALSRYALIPVIDDEGFVLRESHTILRYLACKHQRLDFYPEEAEARARIEAWMDWAGAELGNAVRAVFLGGYIKSPRYHVPEFVEKSKVAWNDLMQRLDEEFLEAGPYLMGRNLTLADIPIGAYVHRWMSLDFKKPDLGGIKRYYEQLSSRPPYRTFLLTGAP